MKINVTAQHIAKGQPAHGTKCPVGLALKTAGFKVNLVTSDWLYVIPHGGVRTPPVARAFIKRFDRTPKATFAPFSFEVPWKAPRKKSTRKTQAKKRTSATKPRP
jgi:hypothetical protein